MTDFDYDYIIAGAGCAGLSLAIHLIDSGKFHHKKVLVVDHHDKTENDRTWCFWETGNGVFEDVVYKTWRNIKIKDTGYKQKFNIHPYQYKLIRGIDFYNYSLKKISEQSNFTIIKAGIESVFSRRQAGIVADGQKYTSEYVFNSIFEKPTLRSHDFWLLQHFTGWRIKTQDAVFDPETATLMDFNIPQENGTSFFYVLPFSRNEALVEFTVFSGEVLDKSKYKSALEDYISNQLQIEHFEILETEFGVIPMTNAMFQKSDGQIINLGTSGGNTKGSTGYTFQFIQKHSKQIVRCLENGEHPSKTSKTHGRFNFYDGVLLNILNFKKLPGNIIFTRLFRGNETVSVLRFLDNDTTLVEESRLLLSLPFFPFLKAAIRQMFKIKA